MGDEQVQMDDTPIFAAPIAKKKKDAKEAKKDKKTLTLTDDDAAPSPSHKHAKAHAPVQPSTTLHTGVRWVLLLSLIPLMYFVPYILRFSGAKVKNNYHLLVYLWITYAVILVSMFFHFKKKTVTVNSFVTQMMGWMIVTLGIYHLVDLPKMVDFSLRKDVMYVWCSFTMIFNIVYFVFDNRDYQEEERKENEKEERRRLKDEEKRKKQAEKRQKRLDSMMSPGKRRIVNLLIYLAIAGAVGYVIRYVYHFSIHLQEEEAVRRGDYKEPEYNFDDQ